MVNAIWGKRYEKLEDEKRKNVKGKKEERGNKNGKFKLTG
jgi:hypothetical protein